MAKADFIKGLIKAHIKGDNRTFRQVAMQIAATEASAGHANLAREIQQLVDNVPTTLGQNIGKVPPGITYNMPGTNMSGLLHASYPEERLSDMVLETKTKSSIERVLSEWKSRQLLASHGLNCRSKLMLIGPPGCGKTMAASVLAGELSLPLFIVKLEGLISRYLGETSVHLRSIFDSMSSTSGVYLFDEFDTIGTTRGDQRDVGEVRRILSTFLLLLEGFSGNSMVIAATNYDHVLDNALFRRFDDIINFPMPDIETSKELLKLKLHGFEKGEIDWLQIANDAVGMSCAEITIACTEAVKTTILMGQTKLEFNVLIEAIKQRKALRATNLA